MTDELSLEMWERLRPMDVDVFAERVLKQVFRNKAIIIEPKSWRVLWLLDRLSPTLGETVARFAVKRMRAELAERTRGAEAHARAERASANGSRTTAVSGG